MSYKVVNCDWGSRWWFEKDRKNVSETKCVVLAYASFSPDHSLVNKTTT